MWIPCRTHFTRPAVRHLRLQAFRQLQASLTNLGLVVCRAVTDLTPGFTFPPVLDFPLSSGTSRRSASTTSQKLDSDGASASDYPPETPLTRNLKRTAVNALAGIARWHHLRDGEVRDLTPFRLDLTNLC